MFSRLVLSDLMGVWLLFTGCLLGGIVINEFRSSPLPLVYSPAASRLDHAVSELKPVDTQPVALEGDINHDEVQQLSTNHHALILDARPEIFYRLGHIPNALSLPRDDFDKQYQVLQSTLKARQGIPIIVYCSSNDCHDSQMVADALRLLGYQHIRLFRGGWGEWESANLPEEKQ